MCDFLDFTFVVFAAHLRTFFVRLVVASLVAGVFSFLLFAASSLSLGASSRENIDHVALDDSYR